MLLLQVFLVNFLQLLVIIDDDSVFVCSFLLIVVVFEVFLVVFVGDNGFQSVSTNLLFQA